MHSPGRPGATPQVCRQSAVGLRPCTFACQTCSSRSGLPSRGLAPWRPSPRPSTSPLTGARHDPRRTASRPQPTAAFGPGPPATHPPGGRRRRPGRHRGVGGLRQLDARRRPAAVARRGRHPDRSAALHARPRPAGTEPAQPTAVDCRPARGRQDPPGVRRRTAAARDRPLRPADPDRLRRLHRIGRDRRCTTQPGRAGGAVPRGTARRQCLACRDAGGHADDGCRRQRQA